MKLFSVFSSYFGKLSKIMKNKGTEREICKNSSFLFLREAQFILKSAKNMVSVLDIYITII